MFSYDWANWELLGRLHVVAVHFPIALLMLAGLVELGAGMRLRKTPAASATTLLVFGALGAIAATVLGWIHAGHSSFGAGQARTLLLHRWLGVGVAGLAVMTLLLRIAARNGARLWLYRICALACAALVGVVGHLGGTMTHGAGFLTIVTQSPQPPATRPATQPVAAPSLAGIDFKSRIEPILAASCLDCHAGSVQKGSLLLDSRAAAIRGGRNGPSIIPGDSENSPFIRRILGLDDEPRMPKGDDPLPDEQVRLLRQWIDAGAPWPDP